MSENQELERGVIPAKTRIKLYEGSITLLEDAVVDANQEWIDQAIKDQADFYQGIDVMGDSPKLKSETEYSLSSSSNAAQLDKSIAQLRSNVATDELTQGALSSMAISASIGTESNILMQEAIRDAAKALNIAYNAKFINRVEWRTDMLDRLLSRLHTKTVDEVIAECQKVEKYVFGESSTPKDIDPLASWYL